MDDGKPKVLTDAELEITAGGARMFREAGPVDVSGYKFAPLAGYKFAPLDAGDLSASVRFKFSPLV